MLTENLMALASLAGRTLVAAAATDGLEAARRRFARLLGRGDPRQTQVAERRLDDTSRESWRGVPGADPEQARSVTAGAVGDAAGGTCWMRIRVGG